MRAEDQPSNDDPSAFPVIWVGFLGVLVLVVIVVGLAAMYTSVKQIETVRKIDQFGASSLEYVPKEQQLSEMRHPGWIDRQQQVVRIPLERAMDISLKELRAAQDKNSDRTETASD